MRTEQRPNVTIEQTLIHKASVLVVFNNLFIYLDHVLIFFPFITLLINQRVGILAYAVLTGTLLSCVFTE